MQSGTTLRLQLVAANKKLAAAGKSQMTIQSYPKDSDAFQQLIAGNVDAYYTVTSTAAYYSKKTGGKTELAGPQISALPFGIATLKDNDVRLVSYVPDNVLRPLIKGVCADNYFMPVVATREDEAIGTVTGAVP